MTPSQELALLRATSAGLEGQLRDAYQRLLDLIRAGVPPRDAVQRVMDTFSGAMAETMAAALSAIIGASVGTAAAMDLEVGAVQLSRRLYAQATKTSQIVAGIVQRHAGGFQDARALALQMFEGYGFRQPGAEPLQLSPRNPRLPAYLREALLDDGTVRKLLVRAFARFQVDNLKTQALRAAYSEALAAIDAVEAGAGARLLERRLRVAFFERMRYFANRIAQTELHRAFARREAALIMADDDVEFVQIRRAPGGGDCICSLYAGRDQYGMGPGVYPKALAPVPGFHPFCRCVTAPRLDLTGKKAKPLDEEADVYFLQRLKTPIAARIIGSRDKLEQVLGGATADQVHNASLDPAYRVRKMAEYARRDQLEITP